MKFLKFAFIVIYSLITTSTFAQNWRTGGNAPCPGPQCVDNSNNILGPIDNVPLNIITNGIQRMVVMGGTIANNQGRVGMGNNLPAGFSPASRLHLHQTGGFPSIRFSTNFTGFGGNSGFQIGYNNTLAELNNRENSVMRFRTDNRIRAEFSTNSGLGGPNLGINLNAGDGLRIYPAVGNPGVRGIDIWTGNTGGTTHMKFDASGLLQGIQNRFEIVGRRTGLWFDVSLDNLNPNMQNRYIFNRNAIEMARVGINDFWRIGSNPNSIDAVRRLEVTDDNWQLRLDNSFAGQGAYTDFFTQNLGDLLIDPSGDHVGINFNNTGAGLTHTIDVNGDARIRFTPTAIAPQSIIIGQMVGGNMDDRELQRLDFPGTSNTVLLGNGTFGLVPGGGIGNTCGATPNPLIGDYEIDLAGNDLFIHNDGNVLIGDAPCGSIPTARLMVRNTNPNPLVPDIGIWSECMTLGTAGVFRGAGTGIHVEAYMGPTPITVGVLSYAEAVGTFTVGVGGSAKDASVRNVGVRGEAISNSTVENIGVMGAASGSTGINYAGLFNGDVYINGPSQTAGLALTASDQQFKTNINSITNPIGIIQQLQPKTYFYDTTNAHNIRFNSNRQYGFIAQEVEIILPELVGEVTKPAEYDSLGNVVFSSVTYKNLNYNALIGILTAAVKEQQSELDSIKSSNQDLEERLAAMETCITESNLCSGHARLDNQNNNEGKVIELANLNAIILDQNLPNPFKEKTTINYSIPEEVMEAELLFYDMNGRVIKKVNIDERGEGKLTVYGENLKNGIYTYSLIADGELISTKRMVKSK